MIPLACGDGVRVRPNLETLVLVINEVGPSLFASKLSLVTALVTALVSTLSRLRVKGQG